MSEVDKSEVNNDEVGDNEDAGIDEVDDAGDVSDAGDNEDAGGNDDAGKKQLAIIDDVDDAGENDELDDDDDDGSEVYDDKKYSRKAFKVTEEIVNNVTKCIDDCAKFQQQSNSLNISIDNSKALIHFQRGEIINVIDSSFKDKNLFISPNARTIIQKEANRQYKVLMKVEKVKLNNKSDKRKSFLEKKIPKLEAIEKKDESTLKLLSALKKELERLAESFAREDELIQKRYRNNTKNFNYALNKLRDKYCSATTGKTKVMKEKGNKPKNMFISFNNIIFLEARMMLATMFKDKKSDDARTPLSWNVIVGRIMKKKEEFQSIKKSLQDLVPSIRTETDAPAEKWNLHQITGRVKQIINNLEDLDNMNTALEIIDKSLVLLRLEGEDDLTEWNEIEKRLLESANLWRREKKRKRDEEEAIIQSPTKKKKIEGGAPDSVARNQQPQDEDE